MATPCAAQINDQKVEPFDLTDDQRSKANEFLTSPKPGSPLKTGGSSQTLVQAVQAANFMQGLEARRGQLDPATASLEARLKRLEDALQRPLALGEFED